ncbi:MAG TPA: M14 family zinc carboxypeptidase [Gemmatimonadales bacterium]|nr:M14 family zinc carboxypeptidase [Gemmatimonadales bacterium]
MSGFRRLITLGVVLAPVIPIRAQQPIDSVYTARIRDLTPTDKLWKFTTDLVDHLPASATVPTPLKVLGYVPGTIGRLSYTADINRYFRALAAASPRVKIFSMGPSDEGREMIVAAISDDATMAHLDEFKARMAQLADPRKLTPATRAQLLKDTKPIYWLTGSIHSPETGSPEMLMELAYRLAVDESEYIRSIRSNVITLITPVLEVDGRDRMVDVLKQQRESKLAPGSMNLIYWGKYTAHDNNRDAIVLSQKLTQNVMKTFLDWHPTVAHDLHESVPFLYVSTGTGPYNDEYDPIQVDEWYTLAFQEITELTRRGLPGVWTHGFYDGWAPNYTILSVANLHNGIGRFYETYTSRGADCHTVALPPSATERIWYRPNQPVNGIKWCIRSNINYQQSGVLIAMKYVGDHREVFLENFVSKGERMIRKGQTTAPYAWVIPRGQRHASEAADLVNLLRANATEVQVAGADFTLARNPMARGDTSRANQVSVKQGDWIVRMDQPYTQTIRTLLGIQRFKADDPTPYDDTGWTLDALRHIETTQVADSQVLNKPMAPLTGNAKITGTVKGTGSTYLVRHLGDWRSAVLPWKTGTARVSVADSAFAVGDEKYPAGTFIVTDVKGSAAPAIAALGLDAVTIASPPAVAQHPIKLPRIALMHTWRETQNEGWVRFALDQFGVPYTYISDQMLKRPAELDPFDVVVFPHVSTFGGSLLNGVPMVGPPIPWKKSALTPNLSSWDQTDDMRPGMGLDGAAALRRFVERGGLLLVEGASDELPLSLGFTPTVNLIPARALRVRGSVIRAQTVAANAKSPILYGYDRTSFPVYFNQSPLLTVTPRDTTLGTRENDQQTDPAITAELERLRARVIVQFHERADSLLVSGLLVGGDELARKAAVVDAPLGSGHVVYFAIRPLWRWESQGTFAMALNALANWDQLK